MAKLASNSVRNACWLGGQCEPEMPTALRMSPVGLAHCTHSIVNHGSTLSWIQWGSGQHSRTTWEDE